jgi:hypothetical protein
MDKDFQVLQRIIRSRRTEKALGRTDQPMVYNKATLQHFDNLLQQSMVDCGWAPFHYDRNINGLAEPWRTYWLDCANCRRLGQSIETLIPNLKPGNKLASLLAACGSLVLFTWLPQDEAGHESVSSGKLQQVNHEHLAATAAAVENFLLLCTAAGIKTYWGSGTLIEQHLFAPLRIGIDRHREKLLAAVFAWYPPGDESQSGPSAVEIIGGKQRSRRSETAAWLKRIEFPG